MFQTYFDKTFGFRGLLSGIHALIKIQLFDTSSSDSVTLGKGGWLFFSGEATVDSFRRSRPFTDAQLWKWSDFLVRRRDWLRARGIPFVFFVAPNPQTIYPEFMPDRIWRVEGPSRLDQLMHHLMAHTDIETIDLRPMLLSAKERERVCYKTDTHWNQLGGFVAYQELSDWMKRRFPQWRLDGLADYERTVTPVWHGGLAFLSGVPTLFPESRTILSPRDSAPVYTDGKPLSADETADAWTIRPVVVRQSHGGELDSAVILRDSQFAAPAQFLSHHFKRAVLLWTPILDPAIIDRERPQVVIQEMVERQLMNEVPQETLP